jgi:SSS family solute:Na+ symporter
MGAAQWAYASLSLGSALALFMYPHSVTAVLSTKSRDVIRRNAALLPAYSFLLGLLALLGLAAIAAGVEVDNAQLAIPQLFEQEFSPWFAGVAFAAIAIGALVPAAIMSIAAANLWTRNIYKAFLKPDATDAQEAQQSKLASLVVKFGALVFVLALPNDFAINLQLLGGIWIVQTLPAIVIGLYTRWFHRYALLAGWALGMVWGTIAAYNTPVVGDPGSHFGGSVGPLEVFGIHITDNLIYFGLTALALNLLLSTVLTILFRATGVSAGVDDTRPGDYHADAGDPEVAEELNAIQTPPST